MAYSICSCCLLSESNYHPGYDNNIHGLEVHKNWVLLGGVSWAKGEGLSPF